MEKMIDLRGRNLQKDAMIHIDGVTTKLFLTIRAWQIQDSSKRKIKVSRSDSETEHEIGELDFSGLGHFILDSEQLSYGHPRYGIECADSHIALSQLVDAKASMKNNGSQRIIFTCNFQGEQVSIELPLPT